MFCHRFPFFVGDSSCKRGLHGCRRRLGIQSIWWDEGWIPFADNFRCDYICLDLQPTKHGKRGQVIHFNHESGRRLLLAKSFGAWLAEVAQSLADTD
jgi:cell wall assembly regulator SMI1